MLFNSALISSLLFASAVLAGRRQSGFLNRVEQPTNASSDGVIYSENWAGAVWEKGDGTFTTITGTFTVPVPTGQSGSAASAWVGIDGSTCQNAILQTGVDFFIDNNGASAYEAWYEWYPDYAYPFSDLSISAGDVIKITVTAYSAKSGIAKVENLSNGQSAHKHLRSRNGNNVPFADFGKVTFKDARATGTTGTYTPDGATILDIKQNNKVLTSAWVDGSSVTIKYV